MKLLFYSNLKNKNIEYKWNEYDILCKLLNSEITLFEATQGQQMGELLNEFFLALKNMAQPLLLENKN